MRTCFRLYDTINGRYYSGVACRAPWAALNALERYMAKYPSRDPVVKDHLGLPVSANTLRAMTASAALAVSSR